jgi:hypothetical protein
VSKLGLIVVILFIVGTICGAVFQWRWANRTHPYLLNREGR